MTDGEKREGGWVGRLVGQDKASYSVLYGRTVRVVLWLDQPDGEPQEQCKS